MNSSAVPIWTSIILVQMRFSFKIAVCQRYENLWAYTTAFITYGTYGWIEEWINRGMQESAETMAELLSLHGIK